MISSIGISQSGLLAASKVLNVSANNIANSNTAGFKKDAVTLSEGENGGVDVSVSKSRDGATGVKFENGKRIETSNVNIADEFVTQIVGGHQFTANLTALKSVIEREGELLDVLA